MPSGAKSVSSSIIVGFNLSLSYISARAVPQRAIISVYHHVRRARHPLKQQGKWLPAEDEKLKE